MTRFEAYVPVLLNFRDNRLVYSSHDLALLKKSVLEADDGIAKLAAGRGDFRHNLSTEWLPQNLIHLFETGQDTKSVAATKRVAEWVTRVEVYYYHHRIILKYVFHSDFSLAFERVARQLILAHSKHIIVTRFIEKINSANAHGGPVPDEFGRVTAYYSYCILLVPLETKSFHKAEFVSNMENLLGSHTFRIVEVTPKILERDRIHVVRISIPSINLYSTGEIDRFLRVDILNAIYQHMLYSKKEQDEGSESLRELTNFSTIEVDKRNVMEETQLHALWDHAVDALGGRMVDLQGVHQQTLLFRASILALILALVGIILTVILALH